MRRKHLLWIAPWIACGLGACATVRLPVASKACAEWRWIGIRSPSEDSCPHIAGWSELPLFAAPKEDVQEAYHSLSVAANLQEAYDTKKGENAQPELQPDPKVVQQLERFCVYKKDRKWGKAPFLPTASSKLVRIDKDCPATLQAGPTATATDWEIFSNHFLAQAGKLTNPPPSVSPIDVQTDVRLAFLDTHPTGEGVPAAPPRGMGTSEHGYTLAQIARNLLCGPEASDRCAARITTRLALPIRRFHPRSQKLTWIDESNGGHVGLQSHLAEAIQREVNAWLTDRERGGPQHLVLNLSVAWDGELFGGLTESQIAEMRAGTQAVYWALRYAADLDVLVLAAAGNAKNCCNEKETVGPLLPAAWEKGTPPDGFCGEPPKTPLLYAVGGVDSRGRPLFNARPGGMPQRAAYGKYAVVPASTREESTRMYTGSSIATAVVSSIAASVWNTLPGHESSEVMDLLYRSGDDLTPLVADFSFGSAFPAPPVHRLSLCTALRAACGVPGARGCPSDVSCVPRPSNDPPDPPWLSFLRRRSCNPWLLPQPEEDPCPICKPPRY